MATESIDEQPIAVTTLVKYKEDTWKNILRPVTILQLIQADVEPIPDSRQSLMTIEERCCGTVSLIAHVISIELSPTRAIYVLEDGTGRIHGEKDLDSINSDSGQSAEAEEEKAQHQSLEHTYIEVTGSLRQDKAMKSRLFIKSIQPVHGYDHVMYHILHVIQSGILTPQHVQPYSSDDDMEIYVPVDGIQHHQDVGDVHHADTLAAPASPAVLSNVFSPKRHHPYAILKPLERAIMKYMHHNRNHSVLIVDLAQAIQASHGCTEVESNLAIQVLLSEAYITSPLDDGYVVMTPRR